MKRLSHYNLTEVPQCEEHPYKIGIKRSSRSGRALRLVLSAG